jgi:predicted RNA binding protein YcfA (HicA-like mRNA interferase family)
MPIKTRKIDSALKKKGFKIVKEKEDHIYYYFFISEKKTPIHTKLSHGIKEYNDGLLSAIRKQLKFDNKEELEDFIECTKSLEQYIEMLENKSII